MAAEIEASQLNRRSALRLLALAGASLATSGGPSHAFVDFFSSFQPASPAVLRDLDIPFAWRGELGSQLPNYAQFLQRVKLRKLTVRQVIAPHTKSRGTVHNTLPPRALWGNIRSTVKAVDLLAQRLDEPIKEIASAYRSPAYNARCPGAMSNSYHLRNNAIDVVFDCAPGKVAAMARAMRAAGLFKGGVGLYPGFTHVDTRGRNADW